MSIADIDGLEVDQIDHGSTWALHALGDLSVKGARSFWIRVLRAASHDWPTVAKIMGTVSSVVRKDAEWPPMFLRSDAAKQLLVEPRHGCQPDQSPAGLSGSLKNELLADPIKAGLLLFGPSPEDPEADEDTPGEPMATEQPPGCPAPGPRHRPDVVEIDSELLRKMTKAHGSSDDPRVRAWLSEMKEMAVPQKRRAFSKRVSAALACQPGGSR